MQIFTIDNNKDIKEYCHTYGFKVKDFKPIQFVCDYYETRNSWGHIGRVLYNNQDINITDRIRYYNRTWEQYQYQSLLKNLIIKTMTYLFDNKIDFRYVYPLTKECKRDMNKLTKKDFLTKYKNITSKEYTEIKKFYNKEVK